MILDFWEKISYMVQLIFACLIFMLPVSRKRHFEIRVILGSAILLISAYFINSIYVEQSYGILFLAYWAYYIVASMLFVWLGTASALSAAAYCTACACAMQHVAFDVYLIYRSFGGDNIIAMLLIYIIIYGLFYKLFAGKLTNHGEFLVSSEALFPIVTIILLVWLLSLLESSGLPGFEAGTGQRIIYRIIDALCCFYVLWVQINQKEKLSLQRELDGINNAWLQQKKQYRVTSENINCINRKCHDLKHQIRALRQMTDEQEKEEFFNEIENAIMIYDTALKTGNKALDTVLMEKGLFCKNHNIAWSCMADGSKLDFMRLEDIYAIFGNALDNAIAAVLALKDPKKRVISVKIITQQSLLVIQIQNYYDNKLHFEDGLPVTNKKNKRDHGYGMKSIRYTAEKYNGTITVKTEENIFMLQVLIPVLEEV